jgi:ubiquinone/menaquinone biosynthesis C-methylase UbiE
MQPIEERADAVLRGPAVAEDRVPEGAQSLHWLDRAGYRIQQGGLAVSLGIVIRTMHFIFNPSAKPPPMEALDALRRRYFDLLDQDLRNVERGFYPRDLLFQFPYLEYARLLPDALADVPRIVSRRKRRQHDDLPKGIEAARYPSYYLRNFHWQTDGWLSDRSANLYDLSVEVLFQGTGDVMRRMAIPPVALGLAADRARSTKRVLDIACGTGRFLLQLHRAMPFAKLYGVDLSPHYIARAKKLLEGIPDIALLAENAESIPLQGDLFDAVTSVFLFHELPKDARRNVIREAYRVLRPGGRLVICDSAQLADSPELKDFLDAFEMLYHEPFYKSYVRDDLTSVLTECGFESVSSTPRFLSKIVVGVKPGGPAEFLG